MAVITRLWEVKLLDSLILINMDGAWNQCGGAKFGPVAQIKELWVENSQNINCSDVTPIREGRVDL